MLRLAGLGIVNLRARHQRLQHIRQHLRIRTRRQRALLRPPQLRRRDHFHGLGDLPRVDHAADAPPDVENVGHCRMRRNLLRLALTHCVLLCRDVASYVSTNTSYFATACLAATNCCFASLITPCNWPFSASSRIFFSMIVRSRPGLVESTYL